MKKCLTLFNNKLIWMMTFLLEEKEKLLMNKDINKIAHISQSKKNLFIKLK